jgi:hypothetical protein
MVREECPEGVVLSVPCVEGPTMNVPRYAAGASGDAIRVAVVHLAGMYARREQR